MVRGHADRHGAGPPRAARPGHRPRRLRLRQPLLGRVRHRGDPSCAPPRRRGGARVLGADRPVHRGGDRHRDFVVPPEHRGVPAGRQRLHRGQGQPGGVPGPDRRGGPPHRLHADRGGQRVRGCRRAHLRLSRALPVPRGARHRPRRARHGGEPAGPPGVGAGVRGMELSLHRRLRPDDRVRIRGARALGPPSGGADRGPAAAPRRLRGVPAPARLRLRRGGAHRDRGGLGRHPRFPAAGGAQRPARARGPRADHGHAVPRHHGAGGQLRDRAARSGDRGLAARPRGLRGRPALRLDPGRLDGHPGAGREHRVRRLSAALDLHGARRLLPRQFASRGDRLAFSNGVSSCARRRFAIALFDGTRITDPAVRPRCLPVLHAVADGHGAPLAHAAARGMAAEGGDQRAGRDHHRAGDGGHRGRQVPRTARGSWS